MPSEFYPGELVYMDHLRHQLQKSQQKSRMGQWKSFTRCVLFFPGDFFSQFFYGSLRKKSQYSGEVFFLQENHQQKSVHVSGCGEGFYNGISTAEVDTLAAETCD